MTIGELPQLRVIPNFINGEDLLQWQNLLFNDSFWSGGAAFPGMINYVQPTMPKGFEDMETILTDRIASEVEAYYGFEVITSTNPGFRKWTTGGHQGPHYDHADFQVDGRIKVDYVQPPGRRWPRCLNEYATVLYWNDNFHGGDIYFVSHTNNEIPIYVITPTPGLLIMFPCSEYYAHGVTEVTQGERIISTHFWTKAQTAASLIHGFDVGDEPIHRRYGNKVAKRLGDGFFPHE